MNISPTAQKLLSALRRGGWDYQSITLGALRGEEVARYHFIGQAQIRGRNVLMESAGRTALQAIRAAIRKWEKRHPEAEPIR